MDSEVNETIEVAALGRPFSLGMLYDCRKDSLVPGITLWDRSDLIKHIGERPQNYNNFEIVSSESIEGKSSALNVEASLKASFMSGLVQVGGSAKYLSDSKTSKNQARVTLTYIATNKIQELSMDHLAINNMKHPYIFEKGLATHVVTAILHGAQAFFVFDRLLSEKEDHSHIEGNLKLMIKQLPSLAVDGKGSLKMENKDQENCDKFSCSFYGDFSLPKPPTSFTDAIEVYKSLPSLLGPNGENSVPMKVWLLPLTSLNSSAAKIVRQISIRLVQESQSVLEDFSELEMRCNDALNSTTVQQFPQIGKKIKAFKETCSEFKLNFQQTLAKRLPLIRGGGEEESVLAGILMKRHSSPFNSKDLHEWMDCKEREIYTLTSFTKMMKNTKVVPSQNLFKEILNAEHAVCYVFTSLDHAEPYLSDLSSYLKQTPKIDDPRDVEREPWYVSKEVSNATRHRAKLFSDFAEANKENNDIKFFAVGLTNETQKGSSIYYYNEGFSTTENFEPPSKPETTVSDVNHDSVTLKISPPKFGAESLTSYSVEYCVRGEDQWQRSTALQAEEVTVRDLSPNTKYMFRCRAVTSIGDGPANEVSGGIKTLPCSPPGQPHVDLNSSEISVVWEKPAEIGQDVQTVSYIVEYAETDHGENLQWKQITSSTEKVIISGLRYETEYVVRVRCDCGAAGRSKESIGVNVCISKLQRLNVTIDGLLSESPSISNLPLKDEDIDADGCRKYSFGVEGPKENRTIIVFGESGSGKSTLINGMINYIAGVEWKEGFRLKLIKEDESCSQSSEVTVYKINHQEGFQIDYSLTVVDVPGFGAVKGMKRDEEIVKHLCSLFYSDLGLGEIAAVCFVAQAALARLTATQKYAFDSVLSIFGKDVVENLRVLVTFADGQRPPVLEAINNSGVPCPKTEDGLPVYFKFNNSVLMADNKSSEEGGFEEIVWNKWTESMKSFFAALRDMTTKNLKTTTEVLRERELCVKAFLHLLCLCFVKSEEEGRKFPRRKEAKTPDQALAAKLDRDKVVKAMECAAESLSRLQELTLKPKLLSMPEYIHMLIDAEKSEDRPGWKKRVQFLITTRENHEDDDDDNDDFGLYDDDDDDDDEEEEAIIFLMMRLMMSYLHCPQMSSSSHKGDGDDVIFIMKKMLKRMMTCNVPVVEEDDGDDEEEDDDDDDDDDDDYGRTRFSTRKEGLDRLKRLLK